MDKFIKQFFIVFAVMLMLGSGFLANNDNLLFLQKVEADEVRDISNLSTVEKTAVYVYRVISGFFGDEVVVETVIVDNSNQNEFTDDSLQFTDEIDQNKNDMDRVVAVTPRENVREIIKEVVVERVVQTSGVTTEDLQKLNNELRSEIYKLSSNTNSQITNTYQVISSTNNIDNLGGVEIYDSNITNSNASGVNLNYTNGTISNLTVGSAVFDTDTLVVDSVNRRVGVGTTSPYAKLSVVGDGHFDGNITASNITATSSIYLANTTNANQLGIVYKGGTRFLHNFNYGSNGTATTEGRNTFLGENAGNLTMGSTAAYSWESSYNTGVGYQSLYSNTKGYDNSALGYRSLYSNTEGGGNSAFGYYSLYSNTTGSNNVGDGYWSLYTNTSGSENVGVGFFSLWANTTGSGNTSVGDESMIYNTTGYQNAAVGQFALYSNTTGFRNVAVGQNALFSKTTGNHNIGLGYRAGYGVTTASNNLFLGTQAGDNVTTGSSNLIIGYNIDAPSATASNQLNIGNLIYGTNINGTGTTLSTGNIGIGTTSPYAKLSVVGQVVASYFTATSTNATSTFGVVGIGGTNVSNNAKLTVNGRISILGTGDSIFVGNGAGANDDFSNNSNIAIGSSALQFNTTGANNTAVGLWSLVGAGGSNYSNNTAVGAMSNPLGDNNVAIGYMAIYGANAANSVAVGYQAMYAEPSSNTVAIGYGAGYNSGGSFSGANNILVGYQAGNNLTSGANNIVLGYDIDSPTATNSNTLNIGNLIFGTGVDGTGTTISSGNIGIASSSPNYKLTVNGTVGFNALPNDGTGYYLCAKAGTGELATSTTACGASSERFKTNINDLTYGLDTVLQLRPVSFNWKSDFINSSSTQIGFIAEEVNTLIPEVIGHDDKGNIMNLDYPKLTSVLVKAMQELINTLDERISNVLASVTELIADRIKARQEICIDDVCINKDQLKTLLENNGVVPTSSSTSSEQITTISSNTTAPVITITGNNPATIIIGSTYADLGATAVDSQGHSLIVDTIDADKVDTTTAGEYIVTYTAFDGTLTATSTRTVMVEVDSLQSTVDSTTTEPTATTTEPVIEPTATTTEPSL